MQLDERQEEMCTESTWDSSGLSALFLNCTLKKSPELSHTEGLIRISKAIMEKNGVSVEVLRPVDFDIATGVWPDMTGHGWETKALREGDGRRHPRADQFDLARRSRCFLSPLAFCDADS